jgi:hypothetical protein
VALPPEDGTEYRSPLKVKTILLPSGEMEGYLSQFGLSCADTREKAKSIKIPEKTFNLFIIFKLDNNWLIYKKFESIFFNLFDWKKLKKKG